MFSWMGWGRWCVIIVFFKLGERPHEPWFERSILYPGDAAGGVDAYYIGGDLYQARASDRLAGVLPLWAVLLNAWPMLRSHLRMAVFPQVLLVIILAWVTFMRTALAAMTQVRLGPGEP